MSNDRYLGRSASPPLTSKTMLTNLQQRLRHAADMHYVRPITMLYQEVDLDMQYAVHEEAIC